MPEKPVEDEKSILEVIKKQIKLVNLTLLLVIYAILFLIIRSLYLILDYVPTASIVAILLIVAGLVILSTYLMNAVTKKATRKIDEYISKLNTLLATTRAMREIFYSDILLENIIDSSLHVTEAEAGSLILIEDDKLVYKVAKDSDGNNLTGFEIPKSRGLAGWVLENGRTLRINDVKKDSRFDPEVDKFKGYETRSVLCAPLRLSSGTIGVLELVNKKGNVFSHEDEEFIQYFADQAATSIERARFYEDQKNFEIHLTNILIEVMDSILHEKCGHSKRVAKYTLLMARALNMSEDEQKRLYRASLLHDIGFLRINPKNISSKEDYQAHCRIGYEILQPINFYADIAPIVLYHQEWYDGNGYPSGLKGDAIPFESRIIAIAEAFDAMISKASYKYTGITFDEDIRPSHLAFDYAIDELKKYAGTQFDPELVETFVENISEDYTVES